VAHPPGFDEGDGLDELLRIDEASTAADKQQVLRFAQDDKFIFRFLTNGFLATLRRPPKLPVHIRIPQDGLHVFAGFGEGDGLDELLRIDEGSTGGKQQVLRFAQDDKVTSG
jgi:hypothetical protein